MGKWVSIITIMLLAGAGWYAYVDLNRPVDPKAGSTLTLANVSPKIPNQIYTSHSYRNNEHRVIGDFFLAHSCFYVDQKVSYVEGKMLFSFEVSDVTDERQLCVQVPTRYPFILLVEAPEGAKPEFQVNGVDVPAVVRETAWENPSGGLIDSRINKDN